jgi:hypothetical protein
VTPAAGCPLETGYHVIMAILLLLHEAPKDEPAQQHDVANGFSNRSDGRPVSGVQPNSFRRRCRAAEKVSIVSGRTCSLPEKICHNGRYRTFGSGSLNAARRPDSRAALARAIAQYYGRFPLPAMKLGIR